MSDAGKDSLESEDDDEELDPRVQSELEKLNVAADGVNHLETEYSEAQAMFNRMHTEAGMQLRFLKQKLGKSVERARPYYDTLRKARQAKIALHHAAVEFENAQSKHDLARKKVSEAEKRAFSLDGKINFAMQDMLNQANMEVMEAARVKNECWRAHQLTAQVFEEEQKHLTDLASSLSKAISKSRSYFELKMSLNKQLEEQKQRIENIHAGIKVAKREYNSTLLRLEKISNEIHHMRRMRRLNEKFATPREQGVGAESTSDDESLEKTNGALRDSSQGMDIKIKDFDEISAFGDDSVSLAENDNSEDARLSPVSPTSSRNGSTSTREYEVIFSKDIIMPDPIPDHLSDETLIQADNRLRPTLTKRWSSMNSIDVRKDEPSLGSAKERLVRSSSFSFIFLPSFLRKSKDPSLSLAVTPTRDGDLYKDYDVIDGKRVPVDRNAIRASTSCASDERYPGEGCDSNLPPVDGNTDLNGFLSDKPLPTIALTTEGSGKELTQSNDTS